ncbi:hypothetical protein DFS34DRAFT_373262 [Phlyctochytrium arcticum]|nr:hypothetical protein DFS34DRAFT_373262 [Phlyctochytrium arcticum]
MADDSSAVMDMDVSALRPTIAPGELSLNVLVLTNEARNMHGLRHQDYQRYRQYCTRKVRRLRQICKITQSAPRRKYEKKEIVPEIVTSERHLQIPLFECEAGWAYAMELKAEIRDEPRKRFHLLKRLRRAVEAGKTLLKLCKDCQAEGRTILEVEGYVSLMIAHLFFEEEKWELALKCFAKSRVIFEKLSKTGVAQREALCQKTIDTIDPNIRFCAYNLKIKGAQTLPEIMQSPSKSLVGDLNKITRDAEAILKEEVEVTQGGVSITWRGKSISVGNEELMTKIQESQQLSQQILSESPLTDVRAESKRFDPALNSFTRAIKLAKADIRADGAAAAKVKSSKSDKHSTSLQLLLAFILFEKQKLIMERTKRVVAIIRRDTLHRPADHHFPRKSQKPQDVIRALEIAEQGLKELQNLPVLETDIGLQSLLTTQLCALSATRALFLGQDFARQQKKPEALALFDEASLQIASARTELDAASRYSQAADAQHDLQQVLEDLQRIDNDIRGARIKQHATTYLQQQQAGQGTEGVASKLQGLSLEEQKPLAEQLDTYRSSFNASNPNLVRILPAIKPVPYKPLFFDVAYNGIQYPLDNLKRRAAGQERQFEDEMQTGAKGKGLLGVIGGLWGRG